MLSGARHIGGARGVADVAEFGNIRADDKVALGRTNDNAMERLGRERIAHDLVRNAVM